MGLGFEIGKDLGSYFVIISAGFVITGMWTSNKPLTTFDKVIRNNSPSNQVHPQ